MLLRKALIALAALVAALAAPTSLRVAEEAARVPAVALWQLSQGLAPLGAKIAVKPPDDALSAAKSRVSGSCRQKLDDTGPQAAQKTGDAAECSSVQGRRCSSSVDFVEDKNAHAGRKTSASMSLWDLGADWEWCFPKECADTRDLHAIGVYVQRHLLDAFRSDVVPQGMKAALIIDCQGSGGGYVRVEPDGESVYQSAAAQHLPLLGPGLAACLAVWIAKVGF